MNIAVAICATITKCAFLLAVAVAMIVVAIGLCWLGLILVNELQGVWIAVKKWDVSSLKSYRDAFDEFWKEE